MLEEEGHNRAKATVTNTKAALIHNECFFYVESHALKNTIWDN